MNVNEFFALSGNKVLIASDIRTGNRLRRIYNRKTGSTESVEAKTPTSISYELINAAMSFKGEKPFKILSGDASVIILDEFIRDGGYLSFIPAPCEDIETTREVYRCMKELRSGALVETSIKDNDKATELISLIDHYEEYLRSNRLLDAPLCLKIGIEIMSTGDTPVSLLLPSYKKSHFGSLNTEHFSYLEKEFISLLQMKTDSQYDDGILFLYDECQVNNKQFFAGYGIFNELSYVVNTIKENQYRYGDVVVYYMHSDYENYARMIFEKNHIPYSITSGIKSTTTHIVQFMLAVLDFFEEDYYYEKLEKIVLNPKLRIDKDRKEQEGIRLNYITGYRHATREGIGWGKDRYLEYFKYVESGKPAWTDTIADEKKRKEAIENRHAFKDLLKDMINVSDKRNVGDMYDALLSFTWKYLQNKNPEKALVSEGLFHLKDILACYSDDMNISQSCRIIRESLLSLTYDQPEATDAVEIRRMSKLEVTERKYCFLIGLSTKYVKINDAESPVLTDEELKQCIDVNKGYVALAGARNKERSVYMNDTLRTNPIEIGYFGYSTFDSVELKECSVSLFYLEQRGENTDEIKPVEYSDILNSTRDIRWEKDKYTEYVDQLIAEAKEETKKDTDEGKDQNKDKEDGSPERGEEDKKKINTEPSKMSSSRLQTLLKCPLDYYYHYIRGISIESIPKREGHQWLPPNEQGNLCHYTMEKYIYKVFPHTEVTSSDLKPFDRDEFDRAFEESAEEVLSHVPFPSQVIYIKEKEEAKRKIEKYAKRIHEEWKEDSDAGIHWVNLGCELSFDNVSYKDPGVKDDSYEIIFNGSIDRLDGYVEDEILYLRIIDYKTGKKEKKQREIDEDLQIQHYIYVYGAYEIIRNDKGFLNRHFPGRRVSYVDIADVSYVFPYSDDLEDCVISVTGPEECLDRMRRTTYADDEAKNLGDSDPYLYGDCVDGISYAKLQNLPFDIRTKLRQTEGLRQNDRFDEISAYVEKQILDSIEYARSCDEKKPWEKLCKYCDYRSACRMYVVKKDLEEAENEG